MGFARRLLSSMGVGGADEAREDELYPGEEVEGVIEVHGGDSEQEVDGICLKVQTHYKRESGDSTVMETGTIERLPVSGHVVVRKGHKEELPFSFRLPYDSDKITVRPNRTIDAIFDALKDLGFALHEADNKELPHRLPFGQKFKARLDELEMVLFPEEGSVDVIFQVDCRARGLGSLLSESLGTDESYTGVTITDEDTSQGSDHVVGKLGQAIRCHS